MTVASTLRRAGPYTGNGATREFAFTFKVFEAKDLSVYRSTDTVEELLVLDTDYSVELESDQDNSPGGKVILKAKTAGAWRLSARFRITSWLCSPIKAAFIPRR